MSLFLYSALIKYFIAKKCKLSSDNARLPPTFDFFLNPAISAKHNKVKHSKARYACIQCKRQS